MKAADIRAYCEDRVRVTFSDGETLEGVLECTTHERYFTVAGEGFHADDVVAIVALD